MKTRRAALFVILLACASVHSFAAESHAPEVPEKETTALDRYIAKADPEYAWKILEAVKGEGQTTFIVELTSQKWRSEADVDRPVWKHWLTITRPDAPETAKSDTGFLYIGGGSNKDAPPKAASQRMLDLALGTKTVCAELFHVPNQPLYFKDSPDKGRSEDDIIAYGRVKFMDSGDDQWLVRLAMVKSAVRAMDAVQEIMRAKDGGGLKIEKFVVAGGSKRGWTTWLTGVEDTRVAAIVPLVIDALNSQQITRHHYEAYGFFSKALNDYVEHGIFPKRVNSPEYAKALAIEDPMNYFGRERLKIPKYCVNASGDEFFLPDNAQFYWGKMPEEKHIRYVPNAKHSLGGSDAMESVQAFYHSILSGQPRPKVTWEKRADGSILAKPEGKPREVNLWQATNPAARDFRLDVIGKAYASSPLAPLADGTYLAKIGKPKEGYTAFFIEFVYDSGGRFPFKFTTEVSVVPDVLPYKFEDALKMDKVPMK